MALTLFSIGRPQSIGGPVWMESAWAPFELVDSRSFSQSTKVDWIETDEAHVFKADLPGLRSEDIKVELEDGRFLRISGARSHEERKGDTWHRVERSHGQFLRRFKLPDRAQAESVRAEVENGVLTVTVPKIQTKVPEKTSVQLDEALKSLDFFRFF